MSRIGVGRDCCSYEIISICSFEFSFVWGYLRSHQLLPQLWCRLQLWLGSDPWPRNSICRGRWPKKKKSASPQGSPLHFSPFSFSLSCGILYTINHLRTQISPLPRGPGWQCWGWRLHQPSADTHFIPLVSFLMSRRVCDTAPCFLFSLSPKECKLAPLLSQALLRMVIRKPLKRQR